MQSLHLFEFLRGLDPGPGRLRDPNCLRDEPRGLERVAGQHHGRDSQCKQCTDCRRRVRSNAVRHATRGPNFAVDENPKHGVAACLPGANLSRVHGKRLPTTRAAAVIIAAAAGVRMVVAAAPALAVTMPVAMAAILVPMSMVARSVAAAAVAVIVDSVAVGTMTTNLHATAMAVLTVVA
mmetsp:Transcript_607/g.2067  ORF Transcript_607/g.2067 Transcript_607/m.2067 type:complete len:180 (+) Transcript_607:883-1422(+)